MTSKSAKRFVYRVILVLLLLPQAAVAGDESFSPLRDYKLAFGKLTDRESMTVFGSGIVAAAVARNYDEEARDYFRHRRRIGGFEDLGNEILGTGAAGVLVGVAFWTSGSSSGDMKAVHAGEAQLEALLATGVATVGLKEATDRARPDGSDRKSLPSGHTSTMFASASVLSRFYGWRAGVPAYSLAVLTGLARVSSDRHWLSDTAAGPLVGELFGQAIARAHLGGSGGTFAILPMPPADWDPGRQGLIARKDF